MASVWFLLATICTVNPGQLATDCNEYVQDSGLSYSDCTHALASYEINPSVFGMACLRGEPMGEDQ